MYRQTIGIPMCTDCAPKLANLFLFSYEFSYIIKNNLYMVKRFNYTFRYIDDLHVLTLKNSMFEKELIQIYPPQLTLKKTTECASRLSYLDISISICKGKYSTRKKFINTLLP